MGRASKLTQDVSSTIVGAIRSGAFDYVAAEAAGIDAGTFRRWMRDERPRYRAFRAEVRAARAKARIDAENRVWSKRPFEWLRWGPGRDRPGEPGWTERIPDQSVITQEMVEKEIARLAKELDEVGIDHSDLDKL